MKLEQSFEVTAPAREIETRIASFMQRNGYKISPEGRPDSKMMYTRGSWLGSLISFSPRKWRARATVEQKPIDATHSHLTLTLDINDQGQVVTHHERLYWKSELDQFQTAVQTGAAATDNLTKQERAAATSGIALFIIFLGTGLLVGLPVTLGVVLVNPKTGYWGVLIGTLCGFAAGFFAAKRHGRS
jgi:F0F1-type ATP synthase assembly protein I